MIGELPTDELRRGIAITRDARANALGVAARIDAIIATLFGADYLAAFAFTGTREAFDIAAGDRPICAAPAMAAEGDLAGPLGACLLIILGCAAAALFADDRPPAAVVEGPASESDVMAALRDTILAASVRIGLDLACAAAGDAERD